MKALNTFLHTKSLEEPGFSVLPHAEDSNPKIKSRIRTYADNRDRADLNNTSRIRYFIIGLMGLVTDRYLVRTSLRE